MHFLTTVLPVVSVLSSLVGAVPVVSSPEGTSLIPGVHVRADGDDSIGPDDFPGPSCPIHGNGSEHVSVAPRDVRRGWYNREEGSWLMDQAEHNINYFPIVEGLWRLTRMFNSRKIRWAVGGGLAFKLHGAQRYTTDIDLILETDMRTLWNIMPGLPGIVVPDYETDHHMRVFYNIGTPDCRNSRWIEVDLIIAGGLHTARDVAANSQTIVKDTKHGEYPNHGMFPIHTIRINQLFKSKTYALAADHRKKDEKDLKDLTWIIDNRPGGLVNIESLLPKDLRQLVYHQMKRYGIGDWKKAKKLLNPEPKA